MKEIRQYVTEQDLHQTWESFSANYQYSAVFIVVLWTRKILYMVLTESDSIWQPDNHCWTRLNNQLSFSWRENKNRA